MSTPGPWTHDREGRITSADAEAIAMCAMHPAYRADDRRMLANARLIASAPKLLEFAREVARSACLQQYNGDDRCTCHACSAREVIAKATDPIPVVPPEPEPDFNPLDAALDACEGDIDLLSP